MNPSNAPTRQQSTLAKTLDTLILRAQRYPGQTVTVTLNRGLKVQIISLPAMHMINLSISRPQEYPVNEWKTILKFWPWETGQISPDYTVRGDQKVCTSDIPIPQV